MIAGYSAVSGAAAIIPMASGNGFVPPGPADFEMPVITGLGFVTKPILLAAFSVVLIFAVTWAMSRRAAVVPSRMQFAGEGVYGFVRNTIARDNIGSEAFMRYVPYLFSLFLFILVNNYFGIFPFLQFPTFSRFGFAVGLALLTWLIYNGAGVIKHGFLGYLKLQTVPAGLSGPVLLLLIPLEFASNIVVRPLTLALRLFANMFAGHLLLLLFAIGGHYLITESGGFYIAAGIASWFMFLMISTLELLIMFLQAYVFTLLTAMYIGGAIADEH